MISPTEASASSGATRSQSLPQPSQGAACQASVGAWSRDLFRLALILTLWFGVFLGVRPLSNPDEGRYAEIPREMAATGDYVTPRLNGVKYFEKPPLLYWLSALTMKTAGVNEWTARAWSAIFAVIGGLVTYAAARSLYGRAAGWWTSIVLCTTLLYYGLGRTAVLDLPVAVLISGALFAFLAGVRETQNPRRRRLLFWTFYAAMALAVLAKGLIGFLLPCTVAFVWLLVFNQWRHLRPCHPFTGALILLAIAAPWHVLAALANHSPVKEHDFAWFYFVHEHYLRFTTTTHGRVHPWWFFGPVILAGLLPWTVFAWQALRENLRGAWKARAERPQADTWFFVTWIAVITVFFSVSQSKLIPYILPVFPALAVLVGKYLAGARPENLRGGLRAGAIVALVLAAAVAFFPIPAKFNIAAAGILPWRIALGIVLGGGAAATLSLTGARREHKALTVLVACFCALMLSANFLGGRFDTRSTKPLALALRERLAPGDEVYCVGDYFQDVPVYLGRTVNVVDSIGELEFGVRAEPGPSVARFITGGEFSRRWNAGPRAYAIVKERDAERWFGSGASEGRTIAKTPFYLLLANE